VLLLGALLCSCSRYCCRLAAAALSETQEWYGLGYGRAVTMWPYKTVANIRLQSAKGAGCQNSLKNGNNFNTSLIHAEVSTEVVPGAGICATVPFRRVFSNQFGRNAPSLRNVKQTEEQSKRAIPIVTR
jgi:hypothetical protein